MGQSADDKLLVERIENDFTYHPPKGDQAQKYEQMRSTAKQLAVLMAKLCPAGRERSLALTQLEQAIFWANAAIARQQVE